MANVVSDAMYNQLKQLYGGDAGKASRAKAQVESGYSADQYNQLVSKLNSMYGSGASSTPTTTKTSTQTTSTPKTTVETYRGQVSDGTSNMNSMSQTSAQSNSRNFQVGTGDVAEMPEQPKVSSVQQPTQDKFAKSWANMTAAQQQAALTKKGMLDYINSRGLTVKKEETPTATTTQPKRQTTYTTPKQDEWDYQDNSQARMNQIADNLDKYRQTMPQLFDDESAFYNFFIDGKGRSQDQIDFLWDYFNRVKKFGKYDNMSPEAIGSGIANGTVPEDYLNNLKATDPAKYQEVIAFKQEREDTIKNESYLNEIANMAGIEGWESEPSSIQYGKWNGIWLDENGDWIDDRRYHAPTEEELQLSQEDSEYEAEKLKLKNAYKRLQNDLTEQYPDADLSTIMILTSDRGTKIQKALDTISVAQTKTQGRLAYLQDERATMDKAGADSIAQLQKNLGMYYQYSPEGLAELAQAKYGATNITLDQADSGNETQKQMALQNVLDGYYAKYGDIIQRSEQQVINDVIAYAKKKGIGLAQALQENFVQPLQSKPGFAALSSVSATRPDVFKIGENTYGYWDDNGNLVSVGASITGTGVGTMRTERNNNPTAMTVDVAKSLGGVEGVDYVQGDSFQTSDGRTLYTARLLGDPIETTIKLLDNAASTGRGAFYTKGGAQRRNHTAMSDAEWLKLSPEEKQNVVLKMLQREGGDINKMAGYNQGAEGIAGTTGTGGYNEGLTEIYKQWRDKPDSASAVKDFWNTYGDTISAAGVSKDDFLKQYDAWYEMETADAYLDILSHLDQLIELTGGEYDLGERGASAFGAGDVGRAYDYIKNNLTVQGLRDAKQQGLKLGVLSDSDVRMIGNAATTLSWMQSQGTWNKELNAFREKLLSKNKYLRDRYQNKSAYSDNTSISFNSGDKTFTIGETITSEPKKKAKSIRDLGK